MSTLSTVSSAVLSAVALAEVEALAKVEVVFAKVDAWAHEALLPGRLDL